MHEISRAQALNLRKGEDLARAVCRRVHGLFLGKFLTHVQVVNLGRDFEIVRVPILATDQPNRAIVVAINRIERLHRRLRAKISATRTQVIVVEMPDQRRPGVVQHPLNHSRGRVLVPAIGFVHRADSLVRHQLGLQGIVLNVVGLSIARSQCFAEHVDIFEGAAAGMVIPVVIDWP